MSLFFIIINSNQKLTSLITFFSSWRGFLCNIGPKGCPIIISLCDKFTIKIFVTQMTVLLIQQCKISWIILILNHGLCERWSTTFQDNCRQRCKIFQIFFDSIIILLVKGRCYKCDFPIIERTKITSSKRLGIAGLEHCIGLLCR